MRISRPLLNWLATQQNTTTATVQQVIGGPLQPPVNGPAPVNLPGPNLLHNPSLEEESQYNHGVPAGWDTTTYRHQHGNLDAHHRRPQRQLCRAPGT